MQNFATQWNVGEIEAEPWLREALPTVSAGSLRNWIKTAQKQGHKALGGRYVKRKSRIDSDPQMYAIVTGMLAEQPTVSATLIHQTLLAEIKDEELVPSLRRVQVWLQKWKKEKRPIKSQNTEVRREDKQYCQTTLLQPLLQIWPNLQQYEKRLEAILKLIEGIEDEKERDVLIGDIFSRISGAKQIDDLKRTIAQLSMGQKKQARPTFSLIDTGTRQLINFIEERITLKLV